MKLTIIGASGHGKVVADIAKLNGYDEIVFLDDDLSRRECGGYPVVGTTNEQVIGDCFVAIGNGRTREKLSNGRKLTVLIHPNAVIADDAIIGDGTVVMAGAVINPGVVLGKGCIVNTSSSIDHDCIIGDYVHIAVGAHLCGTVDIGNQSWIGAGCTVSNNVSICRECIIGAGAVVIKSIIDKGTYIGIPASIMKKYNNKTGVGGGNPPN